MILKKHNDIIFLQTGKEEVLLKNKKRKKSNLRTSRVREEEEKIKKKSSKKFLKLFLLTIFLCILAFTFETLKMEKLVKNIMNLEASVVYDISR